MPHRDPVRRREYLREYKRRNRERMAELNKFYDAAKHANDRAASYGVGGRITTAIARKILQHGRCFYCGSTDRLGLDHRTPLHAGGPNDETNIVACCHSCNASKWREDRPWRWSRKFDRCVICGHADIPHLAHGMCKKCHRRERARRERMERRAA